MQNRDREGRKGRSPIVLSSRSGGVAAASKEKAIPDQGKARVRGRHDQTAELGEPKQISRLLEHILQEDVLQGRGTYGGGAAILGEVAAQASPGGIAKLINY